MGSEIGGGGRYNHLIGRFGRDLPAIGFALDIARMFSALDRQGTFLNNGFSTVTVFAPPHLRYASFELSQSLRQAGVSVVEEGIPEDSRNAVAQVHRYVRQRGLSRGVLLAGKRLPQQVWLFECAEASRDTRQIRLTIPELIQHLKSLNDGHF
jgi:ATP phosphoribosyltransferase regulatory subunit